MTPASCAPDQLATLLDRAYGLSARCARLPGENENWLVACRDGRRFVLKLADDETGDAQIELEQQAADAVHAAGLDVDVPRVVPTSAGETVARVELDDGSVLRGRLLDFVDGTAWLDAGATNPARSRALGQLVARVVQALAPVTHPAAERTHRWDLTAAGQHRASLPLIPDAARRDLAERALRTYAGCAAPRLAALPRTLIHGDLNDENVLLRGERISGVLDFGDVQRAPRICELAIALAYALLDARDPLAVGADVVAGFHAVAPLTDDELELLFPLVLGRLGTTVCVAAERRQVDPAHPTWFATEPRAWASLERLADVDPATAAHALAAHCAGANPHADAGLDTDALRTRRAAVLGPSLSLSYDAPLTMLRGAGAWLHDERGRPHLDLVNNVCHVGHAHPRVAAAASAQIATLNTNTRYLHPHIVDYAERLLATFDDGLDTVFFVSSGSEANELALRMVRAHTARRDVVVVDGAYHGNTSGCVALSPYKFMGPGGRGEPEPWVHVAPMPDGYRGVHRGRDAAVARAYADEQRATLARCADGPAAFFAEGILSCGGQIVPPDGWLRACFENVRAAGGLAVADEVQVGFGRVGSHMWAHQAQGAVPDVVTLGKPMGNGHPLAAVVTRRAVAESFANGMEYFATYGGNPVSCAVGLAVLDVIADEGLQQRAAERGAQFLDGLRELATRHRLIGDVRGLGLFLGFELVRDRETLEPAAREASALVNACRARGILLSTDGPLHDVIKIKPPLVLDEHDVAFALRVLDEELGRLG